VHFDPPVGWRVVQEKTRNRSLVCVREGPRGGAIWPPQLMSGFRSISSISTKYQGFWEKDKMSLKKIQKLTSPNRRVRFCLVDVAWYQTLDTEQNKTKTEDKKNKSSWKRIQESLDLSPPSGRREKTCSTRSKLFIFLKTGHFSRIGRFWTPHPGGGPNRSFGPFRPPSRLAGCARKDLKTLQTPYFLTLGGCNLTPPTHVRILGPGGVWNHFWGSKKVKRYIGPSITFRRFSLDESAVNLLRTQIGFKCLLFLSRFEKI